MLNVNDIDVLVPNFKRRLSGVTATIVRLLPIQAESIAIAAVAPDLPPSIPQVRMLSVLTMSRYGRLGYRVWHARRNIEMLAGIVLKKIFRKKLKLVFTSASQRHHTQWTKWLIRQMDTVIATSEKTAQYLDTPAQVIYHGIDPKTFQPAFDRAALRKQLNLPPEALIIGCFGRIRAQKGTDLFVEAAITLCQAFPDVHAIILGRTVSKDQSFQTGLQRRINDAGLTDRIRFLGEVPLWETPNWYQILDIYVAPQRWEGFGLTPLEAMSCGVPVVAADVGAFSELIVDKKTGYVVEIGSADALQNACATLLNNPAQLIQFSMAARQHTQDNFYITDEAIYLNKAYDNLIFN